MFALQCAAIGYCLRHSSCFHSFVIAAENSTNCYSRLSGSEYYSVYRGDFTRFNGYRNCQRGSPNMLSLSRF
ncbi:hypothetical protein SSYIS1_27100 [Serratia symbiotica]|uniref:Uncharacterized protein n=1 Tax=Serratia symbiotica TaxID=138074 RepID=A0A455VI83_9GAMM|nr:hypothetical protein SSYIS1_27100 [Serratia symbiotica]